MRTNDPVPAPIESTCTSGRLSRKRPMSGVWRIWKSPSVIRAMSNDVPPMSVHTMFFEASSICSARYRAPITPPIGPEMSVRASCLASIEIVPPWAAITRRSKPAPASRVVSRTRWSCSRLGSAA